MDTSKLEGLVEAIEGEARSPAPSHANLARLVAQFCRETISLSIQMMATPVVTVTEPSQTVTFESPARRKRKAKTETI